MTTIKRALISVSNKAGIVKFAKALNDLRIGILSTGGTARLLKKEGINVILVSDYTKFPEMMNGRVKTLHPYIHGGILALRENEEHVGEAKKHGIKLIDMVVVNLYPFEETISKENVSLGEAIENIDIGGPTMIRSAAKNHGNVAVVVNAERYDEIIKELKDNSNNLSKKTTSKLAVEAFQHTGRYDAIISNFLHQKYFPTLKVPQTFNMTFEKVQELRYGENPHQQAAFLRGQDKDGNTVANAIQLHGKQLSFNNYIDLDAALAIVKDFEKPTASVIKHTNPCGCASAKTIDEAYIKAHGTDPLSAFGSIVGLNRKVDVVVANEIKKYFVECVIAPEYDDEALAILKKKKNLRLLKTNKPIVKEEQSEDRLMMVSGGMLIQSNDFPLLTKEDLKVVTEKEPTEEEINALLFGWTVSRHIKSNSVLLSKDEQTIGVGAGQMSRIDAMKLAARKAGDKAKGSVLISDAFFPFRDVVDEASKIGVTAIIQPGGSIRDQESIDAANEHGISMVYTGVRLFKH